MKLSFAPALAAAALSLALAAPAVAGTPTAQPAGAVGAGFVDINLAGWQSFGGLGAAANTEVVLDVGAGTLVTGFEYVDLAFATEGASWLQDLTLSVSNTAANGWLDWSPSTILSSGSFGPASGAWGGTGVAGPFGAGGPFTVPDGQLWVTVYDAFDDPIGDNGLALDSSISAGTLRVFITVVPEPGTYGLMALGLLGVGALVRRRQRAG